MEIEYREVIIFVSKKLTDEDCQNLAYYYQEEFEGTNKCDSKVGTLQHLQEKGILTHDEPWTLIDIVKRLDRQDLVKPVTKKIKEFLKQKKESSHSKENRKLKHHFSIILKHQEMMQEELTLIHQSLQPGEEWINDSLLPLDEHLQTLKQDLIELAKKWHFTPSKQSTTHLIYADQNDDMSSDEDTTKQHTTVFQKVGRKLKIGHHSKKGTKTHQLHHYKSQRVLPNLPNNELASSSMPSILGEDEDDNHYENIEPGQLQRTNSLRHHVSLTPPITRPRSNSVHAIHMQRISPLSFHAQSNPQVLDTLHPPLMETRNTSSDDSLPQQEQDNIYQPLTTQQEYEQRERDKAVVETSGDSGLSSQQVSTSSLRPHPL